MDAINNRSVNEAALQTTEQQKADLLQALERLKDDKFGLCHSCERIDWADFAGSGPLGA